MSTNDPLSPPPQEPQGKIVSWLAKPAAYAHAPEKVEHLETHISHVFLAGDRVFKLKKPVRFDFLDFSTPTAREQACRDELQLNRRLAPDVYLEVLPITLGPDGGLQIGGARTVLDWVVKMRRLPADQTLDVLHAQGRLRPEAVARLAKLLIDFYRSQPPVRLAPLEYRERLTSHIRANWQELSSPKLELPRDVTDRVHAFQLQLLALEPQLFDARVRQGRIVDGHGDLRPEHICLTEPPVIFDCIEFNAEFRQNDVVDELAFLSAECEWIGAAWAGRQLQQAYEQATSDAAPPVLWAFYHSYRACVRAKVAALRSYQPGPQQDAAREEARQRLDQADRYAMPWIRPLVLAIGGVSGTGKTTLAVALAERLGAELLRTDIVRKELFAEQQDSPRISELYSVAARGQVYDELMSRAAGLRAQRRSVILDATFSMANRISQARQVAGEQVQDFLGIECVCRPEVAHQRIAGRLARGTDASDATPETHDRQRQNWEAWPADIPQIRVDTEQPLERQVDEVCRALRRNAP